MKYRYKCNKCKEYFIGGSNVKECHCCGAPNRGGTIKRLGKSVVGSSHENDYDYDDEDDNFVDDEDDEDIGNNTNERKPYIIYVMVVVEVIVLLVKSDIFFYDGQPVFWKLKPIAFLFLILLAFVSLILQLFFDSRK